MSTTESVVLIHSLNDVSYCSNNLLPFKSSKIIDHTNQDAPIMFFFAKKKLQKFNITICDFYKSLQDRSDNYVTYVLLLKWVYKLAQLKNSNNIAAIISK